MSDVSRESERGQVSSRGPATAKAGKWALALAIAGSALAVGTVHTITLCIVTAVLALAAVAAWWGAEPMSVRRPATVVILTGVALTLYTTLQCVPVPIGWLGALAPNTADVWSRALAPFHDPGPSWAPISLDPTATRVEVLKGVAYLLAFVAALRVARRREGTEFIAACIVSTALLLAVAAVLHPAFGVRRLFGLYEPASRVADRHVAPLMNPNHLAAFLNVGFCLSLAMLLAPSARIPRSILAASTLLLAAVQVWVASRGGVVCMVLGLVLALVLSQGVRTNKVRHRVGISLVAVLVSLAGAVLMALSSPDVQGELINTDASKTELFRQAFRMVPAYPVFGAGRGAFASAFPRFRMPFTHMHSWAWHITFTHPENIVAQWVVEWGVPVGLTALGMLIWALRPTAVLARSPSAVGAWCALVAVAIQNLADFNSEIPGVMIACTACAAVVVAGSPGERPARARWSERTSRVAGVGALLGLTSIVFAYPVLGHERGDEENALHELALSQAPIDRVRTYARAAMLTHPAEPYLPFIVGVRAERDHDPSTLLWMGATLERAPVYGPAHLVLGSWLASRSRSQARLEYRLAMFQAPELVDTAMIRAPSLVGGYWDAEELIPAGETGVVVLARLVERISDRLPATAARLDAELEARSPMQPGPARDAATGAVEDLETADGVPWCEGARRQSCAQRALDLSEALKRLEPRACAGFELHARARIAAGDVRGGLDELARGSDQVDDRIPCLERLVLLSLKRGDDARADSVLELIARVGCAQEEECTAQISWAAQVQESRGNRASALALYRRASKLAPDDDELTENLARLAAESGLHAEAAEEYHRLALRHPTDARWAQAVEVEKHAAAADAARL